MLSSSEIVNKQYKEDQEDWSPATNLFLDNKKENQDQVKKENLID